MGEKHVPLGTFGKGGWDCSIYNGDNYYCSSRSAGIFFPIAQSPRDPNWLFGSYHPALCQFAFGDGSVRRILNNTDQVILGYMASINDGQVIPGWE